MGDEYDHVADSAEDAGNKIPIFYPDPTESDFDEDISTDERQFYKAKFKELASVVKEHLHCTACDRHLGASPKNASRLFVHPMLRTLVCKSCLSFYNSGEFEKGEDGSELYCRWCGQGGEVLCCSSCPIVFCAKCIKRNCGNSILKKIESVDDWYCFKCNPETLWPNRATCWAIIRYCELRNKYSAALKNPTEAELFNKQISADESTCCLKKRSSVNNSVSKRKSERNDKAESEIDEKPKVNELKNNGDLKKIESIPIVKLSRTSSRSDSPVVYQSSVINLDDTETSKTKSNSPAPVVDNNAQLRKLQQNPSIVVKQASALLKPTPVVGKPVPVVPKPAPVVSKPASVSKTIPTRPLGRPRKIALPAAATTVATAVNPSVRTYNRRSIPNAVPLVRQIPNDNLNLSLDSLTQGLDLQSLNAMTHIPQQSSDDVVCTPDLPMPMEEPEEVIDDQEDDVQCMTPNVPKLVPKPLSALMDPPSTSNIMSRFPASAFLPYNITTLTTDDVTVNRLTGGLKFKIDPNTLNSNKMYRLPDGRIFAITPNPATPGGFSATIVTMSDSSGGGAVGSTNSSTPNRNARGKRALEPAKESQPEPKRQAREKKAVKPQPAPTRVRNPPPVKETRETRSHPVRETRSSVKSKQKEKEVVEEPAANNLNQDVSNHSLEWYKYNLTDALDVVEYIVLRLNKVKSTTMMANLKNKKKGEVIAIHDKLDQILKLTCKRITEVRTNLDEGYKEWLGKVSDAQEEKNTVSDNDGEENRVVLDDDDDVEIISDDLNAQKDAKQKKDSSKVDKAQKADDATTTNEDSSKEKKNSEVDKNASDDHIDTPMGDEIQDVGSPVCEILGPGSPGRMAQGSPAPERNSPTQILPDDGNTENASATSNLSPVQDSNSRDEGGDDCITESDKLSTKANASQSQSSVNSPANEELNDTDNLNDKVDDPSSPVNEEKDADDMDAEANDEHEDLNNKDGDLDNEHDVEMNEADSNDAPLPEGGKNPIDSNDNAVGDKEILSENCMNGQEASDEENENILDEASNDEVSNEINEISCDNLGPENLNSADDNLNSADDKASDMQQDD